MTNIQLPTPAPLTPVPLTATTLHQFIRERGAARANLTLQQRREAADGNALIYPVPGTFITEPVSAGGAAAEWQAGPNASGTRTLLYFHGGGYLFGSPTSHRHLTTALADAANMRCLSVDYRLAPEHPFPAAVDDAMAAYRWLLETGVSATDIALGGDSAGGGLAVALMVRARDENLPLPAAAILISPWTDLECARPSYTTHAHLDPSITQAGITDTANVYLAGADPHDPLASPVYADHRGLPPCLIQVGGAEVLIDDARDLSTAMRRAGVCAELEVWDQMVHVWHAFHQHLPEGQRAVQRAADFLRTQMPG